MKHKNIFKIFILVIFLLVIFLVISELKPRKQINQITEFEPDGINMKYTIFNEENKKRLEMSCIESKSAGKNKTLMKQINATIFKKGKMDQDISISGESGYVTNNFNTFYVEKNANIFSKDMDIKSNHFYLKGRAQLSTKDPVNYATKGLKGEAAEGMQYLIRSNILKLFNTNGIYSRGNGNFDYITSKLWFSEPKKILSFEKNTVIRDKDSIFKSNQLRLHLSEDMDIIRRAISHKNSYFYTEDLQKKEIKEIQSRYLENFYDAMGKLLRTIIRRNARVMLRDQKNNCEIAAESITINYEKETGNISNVRIQSKGQVDNSGKTNFSIAADTIVLEFKKGEIKTGQAEGKCQFKIDDYNGEADKMNYDIDKHLIHLKGAESTVRKDKNSFISSDFIIKTDSDKLNSAKGIKSILNMESQNALFSKDSIFINANYIEINDKENKVTYKENIRLHQNDTILKADQLELIQKNNINATGKVFLSFKNNREDLIIQGDSFYFDSEKKKITINKNGMINNKNRVLKADALQINFNKKNDLTHIRGEKDIFFTKENITGKADQVTWEFREELMTFLKSAEIKNNSGSITKGNELRFDLKNNKIIIISEQTTRSETIIE